jgi:hypothetical protein
MILGIQHTKKEEILNIIAPEEHPEWVKQPDQQKI